MGRAQGGGPCEKADDRDIRILKKQNKRTWDVLDETKEKTRFDVRFQLGE